jgi:arginyl-tRNA synthetase
MERLYRDVNARCQVDESVREAARAELVKLQAGDEENLAIWREMIRLSQTQFDAIYGRLGIRFDVTLGESFYNPWLKDVVADLIDKGIARESDGAMCVFSDRSLPEKEDPFLIQRDGQWVDIPALVQKADGAANYTTTDLATLDYRMREWAPDQIVYVTDGRQQHHFRQLFAIFRRWKTDATPRLAHVWFGSILGDDGRPFKTRSGDTVKLADLLDEAEERAAVLVAEKNPALSENERREIARIIGLGAVKYADLLPNRQSDYVFSWDKMLSFQGNTAPYLQYSYVRIRSIFRKGEVDESAIGNRQSAILSEPAEQTLAKKLCQFGEVVPQILEDYRPNLLANYLYELAATFHSFFEACPVLKSEGQTRETRLALCDTTARVLAKGLGLLGIAVPERM